MKYYLKYDKENYDKIFDCVRLLADNLMTLNKTEEAIQTMESFLKNIENKDSEDAFRITNMIREKIAYCYANSMDIETAKSYLMKNIQDLKDRIKADTISIVEDKCSLATNLWNYTNILMEEEKDTPETMEETTQIYSNLMKIFEIYKQYPDKLESLAFSLLMNLGAFSSVLEKPYEAIEHYKHCLKVKEANAEEDSDECFEVCVELGKCYLELQEDPDHIKAALKYFEKAIEIKKKTISLLHNKEVEGKPHYVDIARIYETVAETYFDLKDTEKTIEYATHALDNYSVFKLEPIYMARCYFLLAETYFDSEDKGAELIKKSIEYAKRYTSSFLKFNSDHKKEIDDGKIDLVLYTRVSWDDLKIFLYKSYKYIAEGYAVLKDTENCKKYCDLGIETINKLNDEDSKDDREDHEDDSESIFRFLILKYEVARLNELRKNYNVALKDYDSILKRIYDYKENKIVLEQEDTKFDKVVIIYDCMMNKVNIYIELGLYEEAKTHLGNVLGYIKNTKLGDEEKILEDINKKLHVVNFKLKHK